jgi:hypothetical protein
VSCERAISAKRRSVLRRMSGGMVFESPARDRPNDPSTFVHTFHTAMIYARHDVFVVIIFSSLQKRV